MKTTIEIDTASATLAQDIRNARLILDGLDQLVDPAPGHPELPVVRLAVDPFAADPLKVAMDDPVEVEDPTRRELPWGDLPEPPPLPDGKTLWVNRGGFGCNDIDAKGREVRFLDVKRKWLVTFNFSTCLTHIEAI